MWLLVSKESVPWWAGTPGKAWICCGKREQPHRGHAGLALSANVQMYSCRCIWKGVKGVGLAQY